jgi:hypothetical protein
MPTPVLARAPLAGKRYRLRDTADKGRLLVVTCQLGHRTVN